MLSGFLIKWYLGSPHCMIVSHIADAFSDTHGMWLHSVDGVGLGYMLWFWWALCKLPHPSSIALLQYTNCSEQDEHDEHHLSSCVRYEQVANKGRNAHNTRTYWNHPETQRDFLSKYQGTMYNLFIFIYIHVIMSFWTFIMNSMSHIKPFRYDTDMICTYFFWYTLYIYIILYLLIAHVDLILVIFCYIYICLFKVQCAWKKMHVVSTFLRDRYHWK
jgi:hypothetical protein